MRKIITDKNTISILIILCSVNTTSEDIDHVVITVRMINTTHNTTSSMILFSYVDGSAVSYTMKTELLLSKRFI